MQEELLISGVSVSGDGIGRLADGRVVFVHGALPGDRVRVRLSEQKKRLQYAELMDVIDPSPERIHGLCEVELCGGCALKGASQRLQVEQKRDQVVQTLRRIGGIDVSTLLGPLVVFGDGWHYRHRVRLHCAFVGGYWYVGYHERRSRTLVPLSQCPVLWPELQTLALALSKAIKELGPEAQFDEIELAYSRRDKRGAAKITCHAASRLSVVWLDAAGLCGLEIETPEGRMRHGNLELRYDHQKAAEFDLRFEPGSFTQAYPEGNDRLVEDVISAVRPRQNPKVIELHAGIGNFSVPLARAGTHVIAVERDKRAAVLCRRNASAPGLTVDVHAASDADALNLLDDAAVVLLDPPRGGAQAVAEKIAKTPSIRRVVYVSCDVGTLARDAVLLRKAGFALTAITAYDMFPNTTHVETLSIYER